MSIRPLALVLLLAAAAPAQFIYGLNEAGRLTLNGTLLDSLPSNFDPDNGQFPYEKWLDLDIDGPDRYAMRRDGRVNKNGTKLFQLAPVTNGVVVFLWHQMIVDAEGHVHMMRQEGQRALDGVPVLTYPNGSSFFTRFALDVTGVAYALRVDGTVFKGTSTAVAGKFGSVPPAPPDGTGPLNAWIDIAADQANLQLIALRADGKLFKIPLEDVGKDGDPPVATELALLPFPEPPAVPAQKDLYTRLAVALGEWRVLRSDGAVFSQDSLLQPQVNYAGDGMVSDEFFASLTFDGTDMRAMRGDGIVFQNLEPTDFVFNLMGVNYRDMAVGTEPPDLTKFKNPRPRASTYRLQVLEGDTASLPVLVSDIEKLPVDLVVTTNPDKPLPLGATLVDDGLGGRSIEWDGTQPVGVYKCPLIVDDGKTPPLKFTEVIKVVAADTDPEKNKAPRGLKPKTVMALVDHEVRIPVFALDLDEDPLTFSVNEAAEPYKTKGATFDTMTNEFVWTPTFEHIGVHKPVIKVTDGTKTINIVLGVKVVSSLVFETEPPPP